ncbi:ATP phosphoribosyltransferase regulatory subunit [Methylomarinovum tepidoasis]|uniref:ATP phosphoribosyltransferase regulatory subunit n=1 Tax=Methylomarinovum tepidoasis TaxID=2840183 RepID=A0AAU9BXB0_9GAMM|nr:ATP phosphoribosyltransferase regulatory subunit [Methylomarinovum sp. IN45]BCX88093.1 ATP phosphoribosyltransferase regulatory subunit [Methylomarinovum sp. IN45]
MPQGLPTDRWLLPDGVEELLPAEAARLETLRRRLLDTCGAWGYEQVVPPLIEFLDALLTAGGHDLELQTFKLTDPLSGRLLGVRADMTPQVARIDAHNLKREGPTRLCYVGTVLRAYGDPLEPSRSPVQIGAELYGHAGLEADLEIIRLMLALLAESGITDVHLDLGHVGIYRHLAQVAGLDEDSEATLFSILQRKSRPDLDAFLGGLDIPPPLKAQLAALIALNGDDEVLFEARACLSGDEVAGAIDSLARVAQSLRRLHPGLPIHFDLAELRGYHYHTGLVFAALVPNVGREIARGGRYDAIGAVFGRARPAVGFSADLKQLMRLGTLPDDGLRRRVWAPAGDEPELLEAIRQLRAEGWQVIQALPGQAEAEADCNWRLVRQDGRYLTQPITD